MDHLYRWLHAPPHECLGAAFARRRGTRGRRTRLVTGHPLRRATRARITGPRRLVQCREQRDDSRRQGTYLCIERGNPLSLCRQHALLLLHRFVLGNDQSYQVLSTRSL